MSLSCSTSFEGITSRNVDFDTNIVFFVRSFVTALFTRIIIRLGDSYRILLIGILGPRHTAMQASTPLVSFHHLADPHEVSAPSGAACVVVFSHFLLSKI